MDFSSPFVSPFGRPLAPSLMQHKSRLLGTGIFAAFFPHFQNFQGSSLLRCGPFSPLLLPSCTTYDRYTQDCPRGRERTEPLSRLAVSMSHNVTRKMRWMALRQPPPFLLEYSLEAFETMDDPRTPSLLSSAEWRLDCACPGAITLFMGTVST